VDQPLLGDPPNLFFVLDRSASMKNPWSGGGGLSKWETVVRELPQLVTALGPRASYAAAVFPDPATDGCDPGTVVFPRGGVPVLRGNAPAGVSGPTAAALTRTLGGGPLGVAPPSGGTPTAATLAALAPTIKAIRGKTYVILATDGGPNCNGALSCSATQCTDNIEGASGCPPGGVPNCCADPNHGGANACLDAAATIASVSALASSGVPVYVIGVPQSEPYGAVLDQLARAGGTARGNEPQYYAASDTDPSSLLVALKKIAARVTGGCSFTLANVPADPSLVNVLFDGSPVPQSGPDGWTLTAQSGAAAGQAIVTVLGASCQKILDGDVLDMRVVVGCPTVMPQ
jgi:hypothetical protein